jgi:predicted RNA-binding Zn-ribbon protein involved in translation (DUF1610 family)
MNTVEFQPDFVVRPECCPHCGGTEISVEDIMHATVVGGELIYWRCAGCRKIFSRLTQPASGIASANRGAS